MSRSDDWTQAGEWDLPTTWPEFFYSFPPTEPIEVQLRNFLDLPAAENMPAHLRRKVDEFLIAEGGEQLALHPEVPAFES